MIKRYFYPLILLLIIAFFAFNNYIWLKLDTRIPTDEAQFHILRLDIYDLLRQHHGIKDTIVAIFGISDYYPPFYLFSAAVANIFFGVSLLTSVMTNILYLAVLLFSIFQIGKKIDCAAAGLLAAVIFSLYPAVFGLSRYFQIDFSLCAMVCFSVYCLLYSDYFRNIFYSLLFGVSFGLGMLTKWYFIFFLLGPLSCVFIEAILIPLRKIMKSGLGNIGGRLKICCRGAVSRLANIFFSLSAAYLVCGAYYKKYLQSGDLFKYAGTESTGLRWFEAKNIFFYLFELINDQISFFYFSLFLFALFLLWISRAKLGSAKVLVSWVLVPYIIFTFLFARKSGVYIFSFMPVFALITASGLTKLKSGPVKKIVIFSVLFLGLAQYFSLSFGPWFSRKYFSLNVPVGRIDLIYRPHFFSEPRYFANRIFCCPPERDNHARNIMGEVLEVIEEYKDRSSKASSIAFDPFAYSCKGLITGGPWIIFLREKGRNNAFNLEILDPQNKDFIRLYASALGDSEFLIADNDIFDDGYPDLFKEELRSFDKFLVVKNRVVTEGELELLRGALSKYKLIKKLPFETEGAMIYVYNRRSGKVKSLIKDGRKP